ncbi:MAG: SpoIID/LytB domain-containing protein [Gemmatimonadales bacterium]|nr:SpoIID/LytB domain-containing protein [Gemmatimonadales bacterium]
MERAGAEPEVRIALGVGADDLELGGGAALRVSAPDGALLASLPAGTSARVRPRPGQVALAGTRAGGVEAPVMVVSAPAGGSVRLSGREYRGHLVLRRDRRGVTAVNVLPMEAYLLGVVGAELGTRAPGDREALRAQAIVARTYALRNLGRWNADGFDLYAGVSDQVYGGLAAENEAVRSAVEGTRGQVVTYQGALVDAFFFSTCGGRTANGTEAFRAADRPYLRSIVDAPPSGAAYCSVSPRFRWTERWTGEALANTLRRTVPSALQVSESEIVPVRDVRVARQGPSGRVAQLVLQLRSRELTVDGPLVRQVLRPPGGELLRSTAVTLATTHEGGRVHQLVIEGRGAGHGVGFCQWGAIGRARAGQRAPEILAAYYVGTTITRRY